MMRNTQSSDIIEVPTEVSGVAPMSLQKASIAFTASVSAFIGISLLLASV
ncbi:hypothetical protein SAMN02927923_02054 [Microvirga guangxiensis]|uniref:Uncharacterized protein n=1 Tax=Microvirga guangxiensis TaxID=549386 RepID=A0A1G5I3T0_9HYPH|nr:hypothetical protein SAMN02927923_02054 [Microvirga guangxiensis]